MMIEIKMLKDAAKAVKATAKRVAEESQNRVAELEKAVTHIPKLGRWTPFWVKRDGVERINTAAKLVIGRYYAVQSEHGRAVHQWTKSGWRSVEGPDVGRFTHVWMPRKKK